MVGNAALEVFDDAGRVDLALSRISAPDQELLRLVEWDRLPLSDVAALVDCSAAALRVRLHRARRRFRLEFERLLSNTEPEHSADPFSRTSTEESLR